MKTLRLLVLLSFCFPFSTGLFALPGDLDPTFGPVGFVTTNLSTGPDRAYAVARQADGKIVAAGTRNEGFLPNIAVVRYNSDGTPDSSFDGDGIVTIAVGTHGSNATSVAIQPDGKIVVAGTSSTSGTVSYTVVRLNANGSPDLSFDGDGIFTDNTVGVPNAVAIQPDGKIVTAGSVTVNFFTSDFSIVRLNENGSFDPTFDGDGKVLVNIGNTSANAPDSANALTLQPDGKIVVGGESEFLFTGRDWSIARLNSNGSLDTSFDVDGKVQTTFGGNGDNESIRSIAVEASGRITAAGYGGEGSTRGFAIARYSSDGSPDLTFSGDGKVVTQTSNNSNESGHGLTVQPDGKIVAVGYSILQIAVLRYNNDGSLDSTFSNDGKAFMTVYGPGSAIARGVLVEPNGKIVLAGNATRGGAIDEDFVLARFNSDGTPSTDFGVFGYVVTNPFNETTSPTTARSVTVQSDGRIVVGANRIVNSSLTIGLILRYMPEGGADSTFGSSSSAPGIAGISVPGATTQELSSVVLQPDGKILAVGTYENVGSSDIGLFVARLNSNGTPDTSFGGTNPGYAIIRATDGGGLGQDITLQSDGKILVAGAAPNFLNQTVEFAVYRLNVNGSRDATFGINGVAKTDVGVGDDVAFAIAWQLDGGILIGGATNFSQNTNGEIAVVRFDSVGALDGSFGIGGKVVTPLSGFTDVISDIRLQSDGRIVTSGVKCSDIGCSSGTGVLLRYDTNGSLDGSFDGDGVVFLQIPNSLSSDLASLAVQSDGKIIATGTSVSATTQSDALLVRYYVNGTIDPTFSVDGIVTNDIGGSQQASLGLTLQSDGKIVIAGSSLSGTRNDIAVWRHLGDAPLTPNRSPFDFDGDGKTDVGIFRPGPPTGAEWWYQRSSSAQVAALQFGTSTDKITPGDFTGDGKADIAFWRPSDGHWFVLRSEDSSYFAFPFGSSGDIPAPADYDGDGRTDPAVFRPTTTTWFISNSGGGTSIVNFGISTDKPVVADYDGDAKADIAIWRSGPGEWWGLRSTNGSVFAVQFGATSDRPVQGDYTGDGKADIAFWRPTDGNWYILRSEDSSYFAFPFGSSGDTPVPGDYDGDGRTDSAVFRPANATWFLNRSTAGVAIQQFGLTSDTPIPSAYLP